jgi:AcrR family transcriptional regulator
MTTSSLDHLPNARYRSLRGGRSSTAVLQATLTELEERGYAAASLRTIATRAGVPLEAVFARWRSKQHLVHEAIHLLAEEQPNPETGDVRIDLLQVIEALADLLAHPGTAEVVREGLTPSGARDGAESPPERGLLAGRRAVIRRIVERGQRRQQFPSEVHPTVVADALIGALVYRLFVAHEPVSRRTAALVVDVVVTTHDANVTR